MAARVTLVATMALAALAAIGAVGATHASAAAAAAAAVVPAPPTGAAAGGAAGKAPAAAAPAVPPPAAASDHRQENKALVRRYLIEVLAAGKLDKLDEIVAKGFADRSPGAPNLHGADLVRQTRGKLQALFGKLEYDPQELVAEDDRVAARYLVLATPRPPPGKPAPPPLVLSGLALFRVRAGRLQEVFVLNDQMGMLRQLGYSLVPPGVAGAAAAGAAAAAPGAPPAGSRSAAPPPANPGQAGPPSPAGAAAPPPPVSSSPPPGRR
jgi:hypothetical protein